MHDYATTNNADAADHHGNDSASDEQNCDTLLPLLLVTMLIIDVNT